MKGKTIEDAETALAPFGDVEIVPWPDWVSSVPTMDSRVSLVMSVRARPPKAPARLRLPVRRRPAPTGARDRLLGVDLGERRIGLAVADHATLSGRWP